MPPSSLEKERSHGETEEKLGLAADFRLVRALVCAGPRGCALCAHEGRLCAHAAAMPAGHRGPPAAPGPARAQRGDAGGAGVFGAHLPQQDRGHPREHEPGVCGAVHALFRPGAGRALGDLRVHRGRAVPDQHAEIRPGGRGGADRPGGSAGHHGGPDRGLHRGAGHRHRGLPLPQAREGEQEHKAGAPQEEGAGKLPAPSSCFAFSAPASCARAPR